MTTKTPTSRAAAIKQALRSATVRTDDTPRSEPKPARRRKVRASRPKPGRRVDALELVSMFASLPSKLTSLDLGRATKGSGYITASNGSTHRFDVDELSGPTIVAHDPGRATAQGAEVIIAQFKERNISFELSPKGALVTNAPIGGMAVGKKKLEEQAAIAAISSAIIWAEPLIRAHLAGTPLPCDWCDQPASRRLHPGVAMACEAHATGDDAA